MSAVRPRNDLCLTMLRAQITAMIKIRQSVDFYAQMRVFTSSLAPPVI